MNILKMILFKRNYYYLYGTKIFSIKRGLSVVRSCVTLSHHNDSSNKIYPFEDIPAARSSQIFGTTLDLIAAGSAPQLHKYIDKRHKALGPIFREKLGPIDAVFLSSPTLMRSLFLYEGQYPTHPLPEAWLLYNETKKCQRGLFFMDKEEWLHNRRIMNRFLLTGNCNWINNHVERSTQNFISKLIQTCDDNGTDDYTEIHSLERILYRWAIDVLERIMFGNSVETFTPELEEIIEIFSHKVHKIFETSSKLMNFPPKLAKAFNLKRWRDFEENTDKVLELGNDIFEISLSKMSSSSNKNQNDLYTMMRESNMPLDDIRRIFVDLIIAAGDTTAFSTQWILYLLSTKNDIQNKIRTEIIAKTESSERNSEIPYIRGVIRETLRMYPVAPFIGRFLPSDAILGNYRINKGTLVLLSLYTSGRDEQSFPDPLQFKPERWLRNENGELNEVRQAHGTLPFAIGSRSCIGRKIALTQMHSLIKTIVPNFDLICLNPDSVDIILRLVAVPSAKVRLAIKRLI